MCVIMLKLLRNGYDNVYDNDLGVIITGCAVAQQCYSGDVSFLWEKWKL